MRPLAEKNGLHAVAKTEEEAVVVKADVANPEKDFEVRVAKVARAIAAETTAVAVEKAAVQGAVASRVMVAAEAEVRDARAHRNQSSSRVRSQWLRFRVP